MGCASSSLPSTPTKTASTRSQATAPPAAHAPAQQQQEVPGCAIGFAANGEYTGAPPPLCELERRQHLDRLGILDTEPEQRFDHLTRLCCIIFKVPIALVSLVDSERQWFKSVQGLTCSQTDRQSSFCAWTLLPAYPEALVVEDACEDARFKRNKLVTGPPHIRFYAGCPLVCSNGLRMGSLCIIDTQPRTFDAESCSVLANMAEMVVREVEKEKALAQSLAWSSSTREQTSEMLLRAIDSFSDAIMLISTAGGSLTVLYSNEACERMLGLSVHDVQDKDFWSMFELMDADIPGPEGQQPAAGHFARLIADQLNFQLHVIHTGGRPRRTSGRAASPSADGGNAAQHLLVQFRCASTTTLDPHMPRIGIPNFLPSGDSSNRLYFAVVVDPDNQARHQQQQRAAPAVKMLPSSEGSFADIKLGPLLGKGAFGRVYRGSWNGSLVAVKIIEVTCKEWQQGKLLEGLLSENLSHPNVVQTFKHMTRAAPTDSVWGACSTSPELLEDGEQGVLMMETWLVVEFCNRGSISDAVEKGWFRAKGSLFEPDMFAILTTAMEVASAMCYLHAKGILHGDLTGSNILLTKSAMDRRGWTSKVSDFGLARQLSLEAPVIQTRTYGTVTHMPPELLMEGEMSAAVDVYSFGVVCWEMYAGHRPYFGMSHSQVLHCVSSGKQLQLHPAAPEAYRQLVHACLAATPSDRPSFSQILERLEQLKAGLKSS